MTYLTDGGEERITDLLATGVVNRLIQLLSHPMIAITIPCLRIIGNISTASDEQSMIPLQAGVLPKFETLINHEKHSIRKEVCWALSNILAGTPTHI